MYSNRPNNWFAYGDGSDGDLTVAASTTITQARDMYYNNVTIEATGVLKPAGYRTFVKNKLINNGTIRHSGTAGEDGNGTTAAIGGAGSAGGTLGSGEAGYPSWDEPTGPVTKTNSIGGSGGSGGNGGTAVAPANSFGGPIPCKHLKNILLSNHDSRAQLVGGAGGSGGNPGVGGPGGGGAGGIIMVSAKKILGSGLFECVGGDGGDAFPGSNASGGGGGGGGGILINCSEISDAITTNVSGGVAGAKDGSGANGNPRGSGTVVILKHGIPR